VIVDMHGRTTIKTDIYIYMYVCIWLLTEYVEVVIHAPISQRPAILTCKVSFRQSSPVGEAVF
jgi:hypothetical protein